MSNNQSEESKKAYNEILNNILNFVNLWGDEITIAEITSKVKDGDQQVKVANSVALIVLIRQLFKDLLEYTISNKEIFSPDADALLFNLFTYLNSWISTSGKLAEYINKNVDYIT